MEDNPSASGKGVFNPLQPVHELIQGGDPDRVCIKYGINRTQLDKMMSAYQASRREAALTGTFTGSKTKRNDPCPCGSGKKYKKCCLSSHEEARKLIPKEQLQQMEERTMAREKLEKEARKGFELVFSQDYERAGQFARKQIETFAGGKCKSGDVRDDQCPITVERAAHQNLVEVVCIGQFHPQN
jgi:hypothetical protein